MLCYARAEIFTEAVVLVASMVATPLVYSHLSGHVTGVTRVDLESWETVTV